MGIINRILQYVGSVLKSSLNIMYQLSVTIHHHQLIIIRLIFQNQIKQSIPSVKILPRKKQHYTFAIVILTFSAESLKLQQYYPTQYSAISVVAPVDFRLWLGADISSYLFGEGQSRGCVGVEQGLGQGWGVIGYVWIDILGRMRRGLLRLLGGAFGIGCAAWKVRTEVTEEEEGSSQIQTTINKIFLTSLQSEFSNLKLFAFDAETLAREIASHLDIGLGRHVCCKFNDGEVNIQILDSVRGHKVFIIKSFEPKNINDGLMELFLAVATMKKEGAESVTAIIPFLPYSLPSAPSSENEVTEGIDFYTCFGADLVKMLEAMGCNEIITLNTFMSSPKGFVNTSTFLNIEATELACPYLIHSGIKDPVIVGARSNRLHIKSVTQLWKTFGLFNYRCGMGFYNNSNYLGQEVRGRDVILFTNMIRSGKTIRQQSWDLKRKGARNIYCFGFHGLCTNQQLEKLISELPIKQLIMTNSIQHTVENKKIRTISIAKFLAEIITILHEEKSLSDFRGEREMMHYAYLKKIKMMNSLNPEGQTHEAYDRMAEL